MSASDRCPDCGHYADVHSDLLGLSFCDGGGSGSLYRIPPTEASDG